MIIVVRQPRLFSVTPSAAMVRISAIWPMLMTGMIQLPAMPTPPAARSAPKKRAGPVEEQVVHGGVDERHDPEHEDERRGDSSFIASSQANFGAPASAGPRRRVGQRQAEGGEQERCRARDDERPLRAGLERRPGQPGGEHGADPVDDALGIRRVDLVPVDEDEGTRGRHRLLSTFPPRSPARSSGTLRWRRPTGGSSTSRGAGRASRSSSAPASCSTRGSSPRRSTASRRRTAA